MFRTQRHLLGALLGALFVAWFILRPILPGTGVPPDFSFIRGDQPTPSAATAPRSSQAGKPWVYQAWADPAGDRGTTTAAYIMIDPANVNPPASDADIAVWMGSDLEPEDEDQSGFIQAGYLVRPGNQFYLFGYTEQPAGAVTCEAPAQSYQGGKGCIVPLPFAGRIRPGSAYWFEADAQKDSVALAVDGAVLMHVAYPPDADRLLDPAYPDVEITTEGAHTPAELIGLGLVVRGEFQALVYTNEGNWVHESGLISGARGWYRHGGDFPDAAGLCPPITQQGGFGGRLDSYRAGDFGGECFASGTKLTAATDEPVALDGALPPPIVEAAAASPLGFNAPSVFSPLAIPIIPVTALGMIILCGAALLLPRWGKDTGALLVRLALQRPARRVITLAPLIVFDLSLFWLGQVDLPAFGLMALGDALFIWFLWRGTELRERGIVSGFRFIPWSEVAAYGWGWQDGAVLVIRADGLTGPFAPRQLVLNVPSGVRPEINRVLDLELAGKEMPAEEAQLRSGDTRRRQTSAYMLASYLNIATVLVLVLGFLVISIVGEVVVRKYERLGILPPVQQIAIPIERVK